MSSKIFLLITVTFLITSTSSRMINKIYKNHNEFLSKIPDHQLIRNLALIGSYRSSGWHPMEYVQTQDLSISAQLTAGLRVLDIHLAVVGSELKVYYGPEYMKVSFDDVLRSVQNFITKNPKELVIILLTVQRHHELTDSDKCDVLDSYVTRWREEGLQLVQDWSLLDDNVGEHRGQVLLGHVRESSFSSCSVYLPCEVQDNWNVTDEEKKWKFVKESQDGMLFAYHPYHSCYINYLASYNPLLFTYWDDKVIEDGSDPLELGVNEIRDINDKMAEYFRNPYDTLIMIVTEFPSQQLIDKVIESNFL